MQFAFHLFHLGQHDAALEKFLALHEDPLRVLGLYPSMLPNGVIERFKYPYGVGLNEAKLENAHRALAMYLQKVRTKTSVEGKKKKKNSHFLTHHSFIHHPKPGSH